MHTAIRLPGVQDPFTHDMVLLLAANLYPCGGASFAYRSSKGANPALPSMQGLQFCPVLMQSMQRRVVLECHAYSIHTHKDLALTG